MWLQRIVLLWEPAFVNPIKSVIQKNYIHSKVIPFPNRFNSRLLHHSRYITQSKSQYEYDPKSDSFKPKEHSYSSSQNQNEPGQVKDKYFFLRTFVRNLFLITGGVVWVSAIFVSLFIDVKEEEEISHHIKDFDDEVRLLAFYDIGQSRNDLAKMMSKESKHSNEMHNIHDITDLKQASFLKIVKWIQEEDTVVESLGAPVHLSGFRASEKISRMITSFQYLAEHGIKEHLKDDTRRTTWKAECILEGTKAIGLLILEFQVNDDNTAWVPVYMKLTKLETGGEVVLQKSASLPEGLNSSSTT